MYYKLNEYLGLATKLKIVPNKHYTDQTLFSSITNWTISLCSMILIKKSMAKGHPSLSPEVFPLSIFEGFCIKAKGSVQLILFHYIGMRIL